MAVKNSVNLNLYAGLGGIILREAEKVFVAHTPYRSGNARNNTGLQGSTIVANYAYAQRLDQGWSSQSPNGMVQPTLDELPNIVANNLKNLGK